MKPHPKVTRRARRSTPAGHVMGVAFLFFVTALTACLPVNLVPPTETPAPTKTVLPTETIVWFPASPTPTRITLPTLTATPDLSPGIGSLIVEDDFSDDELWDTAVSDNGSAAIRRNRLTLTAQPGYYLSSMRRELPLTDFYAEITARPSLCRGEDTYGLIARGVGGFFYRFLLTCNGQVRAERISGGTKLTIYDPVPSGDAPGAPGEVRIGLWAVGSDMRLFLNGRYQFNVTEGTFPQGALGVFVRSEGETPATVVFSDLVVYDVDYIAPTQTPAPLP